MILLGQAGTGKTLTLSEIALELQARRPDKHIAQILDACAPTHAAGGRLRADMRGAGLEIMVGTVAARYKLPSIGAIDEERCYKNLPGRQRAHLEKEIGIIDEAFMITPRKMDCIAGIQRRASAARRAP